MATAVFVSKLPGEIRAAVVTDDVLSDMLVLRDGADIEAGDLFLARVKRFDKGLDGAFVDLGLARDGLLPKKEMTGDLPPEGTALAVKVLRVPAEDKGARVSAKGVVAETAGVKAPARLAAGPGALAGLIERAQPARIVCDDAALLKELKAVAGDGCETALHSAAIPLFEAEGIEAELEALLLPRAALPGGGFLLIEPGETLTAIDVNAGRTDGRGGPAAQAKAVNLAAVPEIARQLRLRALSGLLVIDFLEMRSPDDRKAVAAALKQAVADDPETCQVFGLSPSGLLEMTRRRGRAPLHELLCRPCGLGGSGRVKAPETLAYEALRAALAGALGKPVKGITLKVAPDVAAALQGPQAAARAVVEQRLGRALTVEADPLVESYALVLS